MAEEYAPEEPEELAECLRAGADAGQSIELGGRFTKRAWGGPVMSAGRQVSTRNLDKLLVYEPADLTVAVQAGMTVGALDEALAANGQFVPLDPGLAAETTVGGALAAGIAGPRQRRYGTARDFVIGMEFATLKGKIVQSGGMVVKNVTGLDMAKLMIGSYGTLAAMTRVNFKVFPRAEAERTFVFASSEAAQVFKLGQFMLTGPLQPVGMEMLSPALTEEIAGGAHALLVQVAGNAATMERFEKFYKGVAIQQAAVRFSALDEAQAPAIWQFVRDVRQAWARTAEAPFVLRVNWLPSRVHRVYEALDGAGGGVRLVARLANGVAWVLCDGEEHAAETAAKLSLAGLTPLVECAPAGAEISLERWPGARAELGVMARIKNTFDPRGLLNAGRLFGRL